MNSPLAGKIRMLITCTNLGHSSEHVESHKEVCTSSKCKCLPMKVVRTGMGVAGFLGQF